MVSKNNIQHKMNADAKWVPHYGLRKLGIGVASVLLGTTLYFGMNNAVAYADTVSTATTNSSSQAVQDQSYKGSSVVLNNTTSETNANTTIDTTTLNESGKQTVTNQSAAFTAATAATTEDSEQSGANKSNATDNTTVTTDSNKQTDTNNDSPLATVKVEKQATSTASTDPKR
ncbi:MAG: YSIRK-type signal peptide-containing protein [Limosilactobacillus sp.]